jgi:putative two-component system response regulator
VYVLSASRFTDAGILVIDDELSIVRLLTRALEGAGYVNVRGLTDPTAVPSYLDEFTPDLVVLDLRMPGMDGYAILEDVSRRLTEDTFLPVLVVSGVDDMPARLRALEAGAKDFLAKPIDIPEFLLHVHSLLGTRFMSRRLSEARDSLAELVQHRTYELRQAHMETIDHLGRVAEVRDDATGQHTNRVGRLSALIAQELHVPPEEAELIMRAAPLHDLGKVAIADKISLKTGGFVDDERKLMREHALLGAELLQGGKSELMQMAERIALSHHERWDGQGYPHGLAGEEIPLAARIVCVADSFDALTHSRPYKEAWSVPEALAEIEQESGWQFDPQVVEALARVQRRERDLQTAEALRAQSTDQVLGSPRSLRTPSGV